MPRVTSLKFASALLLGVLSLALAQASAYAAPVVYTARLSGPAESPPNASPGTGSTEVTLDLAAHTLHVQVQFAGLLGTTTASHIHACTATPGTGTAGVATTVPTFPGFPLGVSSGSYDHTLNTLDVGTYNPAFLNANGGTAASAETALSTCIAAGRAYLNVHSTVFPGGEIRGFLLPLGKEQCKVGGFSNLTDPATGRIFKNQGQCVRIANPANR